ncbi:MAG: pyrrolo-quinoline quinone, partial [Acidobacteriota bacterium]
GVTTETTLTTAAVTGATFGKLYGYYVDGAVHAQPLYVGSARVGGSGVHNVLFVATMSDKVYAFDADQAGPPLWLRDLTDERAGVTPVPIVDITGRNDLNVVGTVGIEGTPVIDPAARSIYLVARTKERGRYVQRLHALDLGTGRDRTPPVTIDAVVKGTAADAVDGLVHFNPKMGNQRPALALVRGAVIVAWASHEDTRPYHGWVMAYDGATLKQTGVFCVTPDGQEGGIWQSGRGPAVDASGAIYFETGNGTWDGTRNYSMSVVRLRLGPNGLSLEDYWTPHDHQALNLRDADLGSTGPLLIPGTPLLLIGSKPGILYLADSRNLGHMTPTDAGVMQSVPVPGGRHLSGAAYWAGPAGPTFYLWSDADVLKGFRFTGQRLEPTPFAQGTVKSPGSPGGALTVSSNGGTSGSGIVWATLTANRSADHGNAAGVLRAYDAETLAELWNSETNAKRDRLGTLVKFVPPLVIAGKVYVPNYDNGVAVYGLLPPVAKP